MSNVILKEFLFKSNLRTFKAQAVVFVSSWTLVLSQNITEKINNFFLAPVNFLK